MFIFRHFSLAAVNPREGRLLASLNCSARCLFTLLKCPISHLAPHFFIGSVFGQASQGTAVLLFVTVYSFKCYWFSLKHYIEIALHFVQPIACIMCIYQNMFT